LDTLKHEPEVRGSEAFLSRLSRTLDADIDTVKNEEFLRKHNEARNFFSENIGQIFRKSIGKSLITGDAPAEAFNLMNSVRNIRKMERIAGETPKGKELYGDLKKAKVRQIIGSAIEGDLKSEGTVKTAQFAKLFQSNPKEKTQGILKQLLTPKVYNDLSEIAKISGEFSKSGRELLNTSSTSHVTADINAIKSVVVQVASGISAMLGGYHAFDLTGLGVAAGGIATPWALSILASNPKFVSYLRQYSISRKNNLKPGLKGNKYKDEALLKKLFIIGVKDIEKGLSEKENVDNKNITE
jgi:hypothetical protein